jgi:Fur family ferric uptake transcriptional regulator
MSSRNLKKLGLKATLPRIRVLQLLEETERRHLSAEDVYKALLANGDDVGLATVYRVLTQFETAGILTRHHFEGGLSVFELNKGHHHDHLLCVKCGKIFEFVSEEIEQKQKEIADKLDFSIEDHCLYIYGMCRKQNCEHEIHE